MCTCCGKNKHYWHERKNKRLGSQNYSLIFNFLAKLHDPRNLLNKSCSCNVTLFQQSFWINFIICFCFFSFVCFLLKKKKIIIKGYVLKRNKTFIILLNKFNKTTIKLFVTNLLFWMHFIKFYIWFICDEQYQQYCLLVHYDVILYENIYKCKKIMYCGNKMWLQFLNHSIHFSS